MENTVSLEPCQSMSEHKQSVNICGISENYSLVRGENNLNIAAHFPSECCAPCVVNTSADLYTMLYDPKSQNSPPASPGVDIPPRTLWPPMEPGCEFVPADGPKEEEEGGL